MTTRIFAIILLALTVTFAGACGFDHGSSNPATPSPGGTPTPTPSAPTYTGTWTSDNTGTPSAPSSCGRFEWRVTNQTSTSLTGEFSASCPPYAVTGSGSGQLNGSVVSVSVSGVGTAPGTASCSFSLSGSGTITGDTLPITYSGTTCFGPVHGTETLRRASPAVINAPVGRSPADRSSVGSTPSLVVLNATRSGPVGALTYNFQVALDAGFGSIVATGSVAEQPNQTSLTLQNALADDTTYYWRAQATDGSRTGPWSGVLVFVVPRTVPAGPTTPSSYHTGQEVVDYVSRTFPDRLAPGVTSDQRRANMAFLRDKIIETGICGGLELALNLKRGGPEVSVDYITYRTGGRWIGVDIAYDYDNTSTTLHLQWYESPNDPYATTYPYSPRPTCR